MPGRQAARALIDESAENYGRETAPAPPQRSPAALARCTARD